MARIFYGVVWGLLLLFLFLLLARPALAVEDELVVSADLVAAPRAEIGSSVSVLDKDQLRNRQFLTIGDALRDLPGVAVTNNGGLGQVTSIRLRGSDTGAVQVRMDGIKVNDLSSVGGGFDFGRTATETIDRIEVLRGPQSTLYGSDAMGGVINISSWRNTGTPIALRASVEGGSYATFRETLSVSGQVDRFSYTFIAQRVDSSGFSAADKVNGFTEKDGTGSTTLFARLGFALTDKVRLTGLVRYVDGETEFDSFDFIFGIADGDETSDVDELAASLSLEVDMLGGRLKNTLRMTYGETDSKFFADGAENFFTLGQRLTFEYQGILQVTDGNFLVFGAETEDADFTNETFGFFAGFIEADRRINSVYGLWRNQSIENLTVTLGVRHDDHSAFGGATTFRLTAVYEIPSMGTLVRGNYGEGFKAPSLFQLFSDFGNPDLRAERSHGWELGFEQPIWSDRVTFVATWYQSRIRDRVDFSFDTFAYANLDEERAKGIELELHIEPTDNIVIDASYTWLKARKVATGDLVLRRPDHSASVTVDWQATKRLGVNIGLRYTGKQVDTRGQLDSAVVVNVRARYDLGSGIELYGRLENLFDNHYQEIFGYGTPGLSGYVGLRLVR